MLLSLTDQIGFPRKWVIQSLVIDSKIQTNDIRAMNVAIQKVKMGEVRAIAEARKIKESKDKIWIDAVAANLGVAGMWPEDAITVATDLRKSLPATIPPHQASREHLERIGWMTRDPFDD